MSNNLHPSLQTWLTIVTESLPAHVAQIVSSEMENHFLDAIDDYIEKGLSQEQAETNALADLGQAGLINRGLKDVHFGSHHYKAAAVISVLILTVMIFLPLMIYKFLGDNSLAVRAGNVFTDILIAGLTTYVLITLRRLLIWRFALLHLDMLFRIAIGSYLLWLAADVCSLMLYNAPLYIGSPRALNEAAAGFDKGLIIAAWLGQIGLGITGMMISWLLWRSPDNLYGVGKILAVCLALMAIPIGTVGIAINMGLSAIVALLTLLVTLGHILIWPVISILFIRAIFRPPNAPPPQLA